MARRLLTPPEEALARRVFQETLPYGRIFISDWLAWSRRPFVLPTGVGRRSRYLLHLGPQGFADALRTPRLQATLIHELTHVWQGYNQRWAWRYVLNSLWHQAVHGRRAYHYTPGLPWSSYHAEQQAQLVQDWFAAGERPEDARAVYIHSHLRVPASPRSSPQHPMGSGHRMGERVSPWKPDR
jgi:hypothetical protein